MDRKLVLISGYYGFDNLGDEAILEELVSELKRVVDADDIVVLSANPDLTAKRYGVRSMQRKSFGEFWNILTQARLFISGGGGLFQNTKTLGSILFYGLQILMAKAHNVPTLIYAQGIGPLNGKLAENICRQFFAQASQITVRDDASMKILESWQLPAIRTADPVWNLEPKAAPQAILDQLATADGKSKLVGLSLRPSHDLTDAHLKRLAEGLFMIMDETQHLVLLPLQKEQDLPLLEKFHSFWLERGRRSIILDISSIEYPSQWAALFSRFDFVVAMRLHALIFALKAGLPVSGIAYDPKVTQLLAEFEQTCLILTKESNAEQWVESLKSFKNSMPSHSRSAKQHLESAKNLACQNFENIARILNMPRAV